MTESTVECPCTKSYTLTGVAGAVLVIAHTPGRPLTSFSKTSRSTRVISHITTEGATAKSEVGPRSSLRIPGGGRAYIIRDAYPQPHTQPQAPLSPVRQSKGRLGWPSCECGNITFCDILSPAAGFVTRCYLYCREQRGTACPYAQHSAASSVRPRRPSAAHTRQEHKRQPHTMLSRPVPICVPKAEMCASP